ncbi:hypothetical protein QAD02_012564 [Eretmocerus hayati]|uniref:Uncharacterized protein n=1 Tax=Eretmocerus hayati TaxID=131215 RepID=A0ACC2P074_9HYME|nr:hypothetical protein QAD02_012564 [Eretmocerus hayati]
MVSDSEEESESKNNQLSPNVQATGLGQGEASAIDSASHVQVPGSDRPEGTEVGATDVDQSMPKDRDSEVSFEQVPEVGTPSDNDELMFVTHNEMRREIVEKRAQVAQAEANAVSLQEENRRLKGQLEKMQRNVRHSSTSNSDTVMATGLIIVYISFG